MRPLDQLLAQYQSADTPQRGYLLHRMGDLTLDFEADVLIDFLREVVAGPEPTLSLAARRTLQRLLPHYHALEESPGGPSHAAATTGWTAYVYKADKEELPDHASPAKLEELARIPRDSYVQAALDLIAPLAGSLAAQAASPDPQVRLAAIDALGGYPHAASVEALVRSLSGDDGTQIARAGLALSRIGTEDAMSAVIAALERGRGRPEQPALALALGGFPFKAAAATLTALAGSPAPAVRASVARALGDLPEFSPQGTLSRLAMDPDAVVSAHAVESLRRAGPADVADAVASVFFKFREPWVQTAALRTLARLGGERASSVAVAAIKSASPEVRAQAIETLVALKTTEGELYRWAAALVRDPSPRVAAVAVVALAPIFRGKTLEWIDSATTASDPAARAAGAWVLTYVQGGRSLAYLKMLLKKETDAGVLAQLAKALAKYRGPEAQQVVLDCLDHPSPAVRGVAARLLPGAESRGDKAVFSRIRDAADRETDPRTQGSLVLALARTSRSLLTASLYGKYLKSPEPVVRARTLKAIDLLSDLDAAGELRQVLKSEDPGEKSLAALTLWHLGDTRAVLGLGREMEGSTPEKAAAAAQAAGLVASSLEWLPDTSRHVLLFFALKSHLEARGAQPGTPAPLVSHAPKGRAPGAGQFEYSEVLALENELVAAFGGRSSMGDSMLDLPPRSSGGTPPGKPASGQVRPGMIRRFDAGTSAAGTPAAAAPAASTPWDEAHIALHDLADRIAAGDREGAGARLAELGRSGCPEAYYLEGLLTVALRGEAGPPLRAAIDGLPVAVYPATELATELHRLGRPEATEVRLEAIDRYLHSLSARVTTARAELARGGAERAASIVQLLSDDLSRIDVAHLHAGKTAYLAKEWTTALAHLELARLDAPRDPRLVLFVASAARNAGHEAFARHMLTKLSSQSDVAAEILERARALLAEIS